MYSNNAVCRTFNKTQIIKAVKRRHTYAHAKWIMV